MLPFDTPTHDGLESASANVGAETHGMGSAGVTTLVVDAPAEAIAQVMISGSLVAQNLTQYGSIRAVRPELVEGAARNAGLRQAQPERFWCVTEQYSGLTLFSTPALVARISQHRRERKAARLAAREANLSPAAAKP